MTPTASPFTIALISMPWSLFNRPSVQLGALKAYLEDNSPVKVECFHPYLDAARIIGPDTYTYLSKNSWAGEALYSAILFPENREKARKLFQARCREKKNIAADFDTLTRKLQSSLDSWVENTDFAPFSLIGFSICFSQLFASLTAAKLIKKKMPGIPVVFGGSSCVGSMGTTLQQQFEQIDYIIAGEGEKQLEALCRSLQTIRKHPSAEVAEVETTSPSFTHPIGNLDELPTPDYRPYFRELEQVFPGKPFSPTVPLEFSRGCWWKRCTFCNLNLQWHGYRHKTAKKMLTELHHLINLHEVLDFTFCDNALPRAETDKFFNATAGCHLDLRFFAEIRAIRDPEKLALYASGGLNSVQVGIESLSSTLLNRMQKGTTVIENIAVMKYCAEQQIHLDGNLILEFPGSTGEEAQETLAHLDFVFPYRPLSSAAFFLGSGSAVMCNPEQYGIDSVILHPYNAQLFPQNRVKHLDLLIKDYRGNKGRQQKHWQPVREKIGRWQKFHATRSSSDPAPLSYRDGGSFLLIRQERYNAPPLLHRLKGSSRKLYLFCSVIRNLEEIRHHFPELPEKSILKFFKDLSNKQLLYQENDTFLALALAARKLK
ncbi:MAG: RiPP maturation radical SAM C-methyltransferase [Desulfopila sp.]|jgi:ribosomal peptide maturation radical SAM protein 1|nr:RiPP maturation radical SAM C-methyltransferase [Desulfopila sp.]